MIGVIETKLSGLWRQAPAVSAVSTPMAGWQRKI